MTKTFTVEYAENGYILRSDKDTVFVFTDEIEVLETISLWLEFDPADSIEIKRKEK